MTTTWPRYRNIESDDCGQCSYSPYQHSCGGQQALDQYRGGHGGLGGYPSDTYPRPGHPCCQVEVDGGHREQYLQQQQQLPVKSSKSEKRERREREREQRDREQKDRDKEHRREQRDRERQQQALVADQQHHQQQQQQLAHQPQQQQHLSEQALVPDCVDCAAAAAASQSVAVTGSGQAPGSSSLKVSSSGQTQALTEAMQVDVGPYSQRGGPPEGVMSGRGGYFDRKYG